MTAGNWPLPADCLTDQKRTDNIDRVICEIAAVKIRTKIIAVLLVAGAATAIVLGVQSWIRHTADRSYSRVTGGMTVSQVRQAMGRDEDEPDGAQRDRGI